MAKEKIFQVVFLLVFAGYVLLKLFAPKPNDWTVTFYKKDKNPYGGFILSERLYDLFNNNHVIFSDETLPELEELYKEDDHSILVLSSNFSVSETDSLAIRSILDQGSSIFIGAEYIRGNFLDTLGIFTERFLSLEDFLNTEDSVLIRGIDSSEFYYPAKSANYYFSEYSKSMYEPLAFNEEGYPVLLSCRNEESGASLFLCSIPLIFTNYGLLEDENHRLASSFLSNLPYSGITWTQYYQLGRNESSTPFRYLLSQPPLKYALFLVVSSLFMIVIFESKRKQRPIPVYEQLRNTSLEFIKVIGNLYFEKRENRDLALKRISLFKELLKNKYFVSNTPDQDSVLKIAYKSDLDRDFVISVFSRINQIESGKSVDDNALKALVLDLDQFG
ncbi:MAG: hypothetical protein AAF363_17015 [Bacteroidota bacterium]